MNEVFRAVSFPTAMIRPGKKICGFLFTSLDQGVKRVDVQLLCRSQVLDFPFTIEVPGLVLPHPAEEAAAAKPKNSTRQRSRFGLNGNRAAPVTRAGP
jgi:hypothetical protein